MRDTAWGWLRRTATGLAAAGLLAGGLQTVGAGPAQASPIEPPNYSDCWSPVNISCVEDLELATLSWVHWFNHQRLHSRIGYVPPAGSRERRLPSEPR